MSRAPSCTLLNLDIPLFVYGGQVRFKSEFYGHAEVTATRGKEGPRSTAVNPVAEWNALQLIEPPIILADHLTWLRSQGQAHEPRLLTTVADKPGSPILTQTYAGGKDGYRYHDPIEVVPLEPFLRVVHQQGTEHAGYASRDAKVKAFARTTHDMGETGGQATETEDETRARASCDSLHLVVDGAVFQVDAAVPGGIARVWTNIIPLVSNT